ncbi:gamma-glutamyltranspeptidase [Cryphonectria parasitica EP155]|uniref:Gamma-glutamyltranspeptidase n=1 Tax=Cryphonectria parasitica (strain ATCC 38755 / EP155) TaxID=660469 RepID=A0A9P4Y536_CRYP1|nr:gamma-glutamyltranspeptidase [Cryphonectria parasitica EP155]KAF3766512.1 gamma-glutamyltranspeptidase [Cryphonectria parasitica EP155]
MGSTKMSTQSDVHGAVASESTICSQIGIDLLRQGGNAADAHVGAQLCVGVIGMYHSGIGGGGFALVRDSEGNYETIDYREAAPAEAFEDMYKGNLQGAVTGGLAVSVPGDLKGLEYLHQKHGLLPWRAVVNPAVYVARNGFNVTEDLVRYMDFATKGIRGNFLLEDPIWAQDFAPNGRLVQLGDVITRKRYADTLEKIGKHGAEILYSGELAEEIVKLVQETNGTLTMDDMKSYRVYGKPPISIDFRGFKLYSTGAPSSGSIMLSMLKTMEQYPASDLADTNLTTHRFIEAMRFAYGARLELGDPAYVSNIEEFEASLLTPHKANETRHKIDDSTTLPVREYDPHQLIAAETHGTSHIVTADSAGMAISSTTTINLLFGAQIMTPGSGIILNDEMDDFSIPGVRNSFGFAPSPANYIRPGKRPMSSITPIIAEHPNGTVFFITGAAGGSRIISSTTQTAWHILEHGMNMSEAVAAPRLHDQLIPNEVYFEYTFDNSTVAAMVEKGHKPVWVRLGVSAVQGIQRLWDGSFEAVGEPRQRNSGGFST